MPDQSPDALKPYVPEGQYGAGLLEILLKAGRPRRTPTPVSTPNREAESETSGIETGTTLGVTCYRSGVNERVNSVVAYQLLCVFIDSMRLFIRDSLPLLIGAGSDDQILKAIRKSEDRRDLRKTIHAKGRGGAIDAIDTVHFPQIISKYWGSFERHLGDRTEVLESLRQIHVVRNAVCHPAPRDLPYAHANRCRRTIKSILARTGPAESLDLVTTIWERAYDRPADDAVSMVPNSELEVVIENVKLAAADVSQLVLDIRKRELTVVSNRGASSPSRVLRKLRIRIRRIAGTRNRRHRP